MKRVASFIGLILVFALSLCGAAEGEITHVKKLGLRISDIFGIEHTPFQLGTNRAAVFVFVMNDCPIANSYSREIGRIFKEYGGKGVRGFIVYTDPDVSLKTVREHSSEYGHKGYPCFFDQKHVLVKATGATRTPEAVVVGKGGQVLYRGRIDNRYAALGRARRKATVKDLRSGLDQILVGKKVSVPRTSAIGCYIPSLKR